MNAQLEVIEFADLLRVTPKTVTLWIQAGMPVVRRGKQGRGQKTLIELKPAIEWYFRENHERLELDRQTSRLKQELADKAALTNAELRGELVRLNVIEREIASLAANLKQNVMALPTRLAAMLEGMSTDERKSTLERSCREVLEEFAAYRPGGGARRRAADCTPRRSSTTR